MDLKRAALVAAFPLLAILAGCDTEEQLLKQQLIGLAAEEKALGELKQQLAANPDLEGPGTASIFLSKDMLNSVLHGADGVVVPVPQVNGVTITVQSIRTAFRLGFPLLVVDAVAKKPDIGAELQLVGKARLEPVLEPVEPGKPQQLALRIHLDSLVPRAKWGFFDFQIGGLVRDLLQLKVSEEMRDVGQIRMPIETAIPLRLPAKQTPFSFQGARGYIATPDLSVHGKVVVTRVLTLPDGLHVYGKVSM